MQDKRTYPRIDVLIPALITEGRKHREIPCTIKNISETGICFEMPMEEKYLESVQKGDAVHFQFIDTYQYGRNIQTDVLSNDCTIRHIRVNGNCITVGGYVTEEDYRKYAVRREIMSLGYYKAMA
ncbi:MAG: PilZ domain-containing protein [Lachnospiraceae bacterium]|nr:PilZ domain-containing protein [Lachnospiraceae bacterium]